MDYLEKPMYKFFLVPDLTSEQSAIVVKWHRGFSDGLALVTLFHSASSVIDTRALPTIKSSLLWSKLMSAVLSPFLVSLELIKMGFRY